MAILVSYSLSSGTLLSIVLSCTGVKELVKTVKGLTGRLCSAIGVSSAIANSGVPGY